MGIQTFYGKGPHTHTHTLLWADLLLTCVKTGIQHVNRMPRDKSTQDNETLFPKWQKETWQTSEETSSYVRLERVNRWPNSMTDI